MKVNDQFPITDSSASVSSVEAPEARKTVASAVRPRFASANQVSPGRGERTSAAPTGARVARSAVPTAHAVGYLLTVLRTFASLCLFGISTFEIGASDSTNLPPCCRKALTNAPYSDKSLFQLDSTWTSDVGRKVKLGVFRGRAQVVGLFFTHCEYACPIIVHDMQRIQAALPASLRDRVDFLLVSFDTERDSAAVLADYRKTHKLGTDHWTLLTGKPDDVRELAALLGINYQKDARGQFAHSNVITLLNADGEVIRQQVGLNTGPEDSVKALERSFATGLAQKPATSHP